MNATDLPAPIEFEKRYVAWIKDAPRSTLSMVDALWWTAFKGAVVGAVLGSLFLAGLAVFDLMETGALPSLLAAALCLGIPKVVLALVSAWEASHRPDPRFLPFPLQRFLEAKEGHADAIRGLTEAYNVSLDAATVSSSGNFEALVGYRATLEGRMRGFFAELDEAADPFRPHRKTP